MGTNYYWESEPCECCQQRADRLHIGKASAGWAFALHIYPDKSGPLNLTDWKQLVSSVGRVVDEHGHEVLPSHLWSLIEDRTPVGDRGPCPSGYSSWRQFLEVNYAEFDVNGLLRRKVDGEQVVGRGLGPWDLLTGDFS